MSASLTNDSPTFLALIWGLTAMFFMAAVVICAAITLRRTLRNKRAKTRQSQTADFQIFLRDIIRGGPDAFALFKYMPSCHIHDKTALFLHYFRTLKGKKLQHLQDLISGSQIEEEITQSSYRGTRGTRMQAVKTLSYLNSQSSLEQILQHLSSEDKYIKLTAARCLVRRQGLFLMNTIIDACLVGFPDDHKLLADILSRFGSDAVQPLETAIGQLDNATGVAACLEALVIIMPPKTSLDFGQLMTHSSPAVRSAAVALSAIASHNTDVDPLKMGLADEDISVKIRAAKTACDLKRSDLTADLYALISSPVMWLRYWSMRAIWASGQSGEKFIDSLSNANPMASKIALEMRSGYV